MSSLARRLAPALAPFLSVIACQGERAGATGEEAGGTIVFAIAGEPDNLAPPVVATVSGKMLVDQIFQQLAALGPEGVTLGDVGFLPRLAERWTWSPDSNTVDFHLAPGARFHDGARVTAADVIFSYQLYLDESVQSSHSVNFPALDSLVAVDSTTVRARFKERSPERFYKLVTNLTILPQHLLQGVDRTKLAESPFAQAPIGSGPYRFVKWERGSTIELVADTVGAHPRQGPRRLIFKYVADLNAAARSVTAGESDFAESLRPEGMALVTADGPARTVEYPSPDHGFLLFNTRSPNNRKALHPIFGDRGVRRAFAMSIDKVALVRNALDSLALTSFGPFVRSNWAADTTVAQLGYDVAHAKALLDSLGWKDANNDGVRERNGVPLRFALSVPSVSATRKQMAVSLQAQLKAIGADVTIDAPEPAVLFPRLVQGKFEAFIHVVHEDATPSSIVQALGGRDLERSSNYGWYSNAHVDSLLDAAVSAPSLASAKREYRAAYDAIIADAPAVFLWEPRTFALAHKRIKFNKLDGVAWWSGIPSWRIPANERLPRDEVGGMAK